MQVGGCVRDQLMGIEPKDWDLEIYGIEPARLREILNDFGEVNAVGEAFTVYKLGQDLDVVRAQDRLLRLDHRAGEPCECRAEIVSLPVHGSTLSLDQSSTAVDCLPMENIIELHRRSVAGLRPVVDRILPLAEIREAHRVLEAREAFGKVVLEISMFNVQCSMFNVQ